jgi:hypothetical protein
MILVVGVLCGCGQGRRGDQRGDEYERGQENAVYLISGHRFPPYFCFLLSVHTSIEPTLVEHLGAFRKNMRWEGLI